MPKVSDTIETKLKELKSKMEMLAKERNGIMEALNKNGFEIAKTGGAIEELSKLVQNKEGDKK